MKVNIQKDLILFKVVFRPRLGGPKFTFVIFESMGISAIRRLRSLCPVDLYDLESLEMIEDPSSFVFCTTAILQK
ncbi:MAG: hypothetical protein MJZ99_10530 [Bacteroidales bacterium]|nr:hypothetical protein [Bacteroidales bacterium]